MISKLLRERYWILYLVWIGGCAIMAAAVSGKPASFERADRISHASASERGMAHLRASHPGADAYEVVHTAFARAEENGDRSRFVVLCDEKQRSALRNAWIVEVDAGNGDLIGIRRPDISNFEFRISNLYPGACCAEPHQRAALQIRDRQIRNSKFEIRNRPSHPTSDIRHRTSP